MANLTKKRLEKLKVEKEIKIKLYSWPSSTWYTIFELYEYGIIVSYNAEICNSGNYIKQRDIESTVWCEKTLKQLYRYSTINGKITEDFRNN